MRFAAMVAMLSVALWAMPSEAQKKDGKKIQCWTDKSGQRMCGDRVPPEYAGEKRDVMKDGRVVDTVSAVKSPEEIAAEKRKKEAEEATLKAAAYDRALLESYRTSGDITTTRNERLALIDSRVQAAEKNAADTDKSLTGLRTRAEALQKNDKPVDDKLAGQIRQFEKAQRQNTKALERYRKEREALHAKYDADFMRYNELRGLPATPPPPPPTAVAEPAAPAPAAATPAPAPKKTGG